MGAAGVVPKPPVVGAAAVPKPPVEAGAVPKPPVDAGAAPKPPVVVPAAAPKAGAAPPELPKPKLGADAAAPGAAVVVLAGWDAAAPKAGAAADCDVPVLESGGKRAYKLASGADNDPYTRMRLKAVSHTLDKLPGFPVAAHPSCNSPPKAKVPAEPNGLGAAAVGAAGADPNAGAGVLDAAAGAEAAAAPAVAPRPVIQLAWQVTSGCTANSAIATAYMAACTGQDCGTSRLVTSFQLSGQRACTVWG